MNKNTIYAIITVIIFVLISGCVSPSVPYELKIIKKKILEKNLTSYDFNVSVDTLKYFFEYEFDGFGYGSSTGIISNKKDKLFPCEKFLNLPANENDLCITIRDYNSLVYFSEDTKSPLSSDLTVYIHFEKINFKKTRIKIYIYDYKVLNGAYFGFESTAKFTKVDSTTIEEYLMLKSVGKYFKVNDMPEVIFPENDF